MSLLLHENKIRKAFSKAAERYENISGLQQEVGRKLVLRFLRRKKYGNILDVGMGTGYITNYLSSLYPEAHVVGLDFALGMVRWARRRYDHLRILQADASALPIKANSMDLIVSNLVYQWIDDLEGSFKLICSSLRKGGEFCLSVFCRRSLGEMFEALNYALSDIEHSPALNLNRLPDKEYVYRSMQKAGFDDVEVVSEVIKVPFADMISLLRWLKSIGANTNKIKFFLGKDRLLKANEYYKDHFKQGDRTYASFEVVWMRSQKSFVNEKDKICKKRKMMMS